ncbi:MAG TPA: ABC transporter permease [Aliicoccus persicus]|uniref:ABC transporter permease n=1 Tax=Aliicoccus persicus TaxID=930138 RepID=A0A921DY87_9STAP|nr:ABC transporter permease [Aliicoccus persicus]
MKWFSHIMLFINNDIKLLLRKWKTLPLLLVAPVIMLVMIAFLAIRFIGDFEEMDIQVGLTNLDEAQETTMIVNALMETSDISEMLTIHNMTVEEAEIAISSNEISANIIFPEDFFADMTGGNSSTVEVVGNADMSLESDIVNEIVATVTKHIRNSQASILAIGYRAAEVGVDEEEVDEMILNLFVEYFVQVMSSSDMLDENLQSNVATNNTNNYYILSVVFVLLIIWSTIISIYLKGETHQRVKTRMKLYGVTELTESISKIAVLIASMIILAAIFMVGLYFFTDILNLAFDNILRVSALVALFIVAIGGIHILIGILFDNVKTQLIVKLIASILLIVFSGALVPEIYFPEYLAPIFDYSVSHMAVYWVMEIVFGGRFYMELLPIIIAIGVIYGLIVLASLFKGVRRA